MKFKVKVIETLAKIVEVEADSPVAAKEAAEQMWLDGDIDFNALDDHHSHEIYLIGRESRGPALLGCYLMTVSVMILLSCKILTS